MKVFIVLHHEIVGDHDDCFADEMVFYSGTSIQKAVQLIKKSDAVRWSWWEIRAHEMDAPELPEHIGYYGRRGGVLATPPYEKSVKTFKKERRP